MNALLGDRDPGSVIWVSLCLTVFSSVLIGIALWIHSASAFVLMIDYAFLVGIIGCVLLFDRRTNPEYNCRIGEHIDRNMLRVMRRTARQVAPHHQIAGGGH